MVGGLSTIAEVQSHSVHTRIRIRPSIRGALIIMLVLHAALIHRVAALAAHPAASIAIKVKTSNNLHKLGLKRSNSQSPKLHNLSPFSTRTRFHRHMLVRGDGAIGSPGTADQAVRALVGSAPPKCIKKCGTCTPCKSVLVPIHTTNLPATPAEYYPEAWRCQCKGKIYNP